MALRATPAPSRPPLSSPVLVLAGLVLAFGAWMLPANLKSISPALLRGAGEGTPSLAEFGLRLVDREKAGPAVLALAAARSCGDPGAERLADALGRLTARQPTFAAWGGWDPFLDPLFNLRAPSGHGSSTPILTFFIPQHARDALRASLADSGSIGVQDLLRLRDIPVTGHFVAANRAGGQPLDALILLTAMLYQGEHLSDPLQRELRGMAETALAQKDLGELGPFFFDLLALGRRLDWMQLSELLRRTHDIRTVGEYAQLARAASDQFALIYTAALFTDSADRVASYLLQFGKPGAQDLRLALGMGQGAVQELVREQVPVNHATGPAWNDAAGLVLAHPQLMLAVRYLGYLLGLFLVLRGMDRWIVLPGASTERVPPVRAGILAVFLTALIIVASEPFLLRAAASADYRLQVRLPMLAMTGAPPAAPSFPTHLAMNTSTIVSIAVFACLQVVMYFICLRKMNQIAREDVPPLLKLRLMDNEDNLFDSGLYVGMMGTAAALVLQVLGVIAPNLLAAYSSNLFGLLCVALVKIRHVRGLKRQLILENEALGKSAI